MHKTRAVGMAAVAAIAGVALWTGLGMAALDGDIFTVDSHNRRIVQVRLGSAAEGEVAIP